jgi:transposase InsO family protein
MGWKTMEVREERVKFVVEASLGSKPFGSLCREFGITRPTGYLWLKRYREEGVAGVAERSRRPRSSPARTTAELEGQVRQVRLRYPDWGARKLQRVLDKEGVWLTVGTIHRILLRHGLVSDKDRPTQALHRFEKSRPNELWQMDFKGPKGWHEPVGPLSVLDDHSRYLIALEATGSTRTEAVQACLEEAFLRCGVPEGMLMDHGVPWWSTQAPSGCTSLALWLMRQGIALHWSRIRHPQTQGKIERFHGCLQRALQRRGGPQQNTQDWLDEYRWEHNHMRPHEALGMLTPAMRWQPSARRYDANPSRWQYPEGAWVLKIDCSGKLDIGGRKWKISQALAGEYVHILPIEERLLVYYCTTLMRELDLDTQRSTIVDRWLQQGSGTG